MKYLIPILTLLLLIFGLLTLLGSIRLGIGFYTPSLTFLTLVGIIAYSSNKKLGLTIIWIASAFWLLRYFERGSFLLFYDVENLKRWTLVMPIVLVSTPLFFFAYIQKQKLLNERVNFKQLIFLFLLIPSISFLSFMRKPHTNELNCWYDIDKADSNFKINFSNTPEHRFEVYSNSNALKDFVQKYGIKDEFRKGIYFPETKVKIITRFRK